MVGVYYNKRLAEQAEITTPPKTLADFEAALAKAKTAGLKPLSVGALDTGGLHLWAALLNVMTPVDGYRDWVYGTPGADRHRGATQASQKLVDWAKQGYIPKSANGIGEQDSAAAFAKGKGVFYVNGNWAAAVLSKAMGDDLGFFPLPGVEAGAPAVASGASVAYAISAKTKHADAAAAFLDYMRTPEAAAIQSAGGFMPVDVTTTPAAKGAQADIATSVQGGGRERRDPAVPGFRRTEHARRADRGRAGADRGQDHRCRLPGVAAERVDWLPRRLTRAWPY